MHYSLLLWLDTRLPTDNHMLRYDVELAGIFPLSAVLAPSTGSSTTSSNTTTHASGGATQPNASFSVLENFAKHFCAHHGGFSVKSVLPALLPSVHSELAVYLFQSGQYVASAKWAAVSRLGMAIGEATNEDSRANEGPLPRIIPVLNDLRSRAAQLTAKYYELLRRQWFSLQGAGPAGGGAVLLATIRSTGIELLSVTQRLGALATDFMQEDCYFAESALTTPSVSPQKGGPGSARGVLAALQNHLLFSWKEKGDKAVGAVCVPTIAETFATTNYADGLLSLADAVQHISASLNSPTFISALIPCGGDGDDQKCAANLLQRQSSEFCTALHLSGLSGVLEIIDRSLPLLPREDGACLALDGALRHVDQLTNALDVLAQSSNSRSAACSDALVVELHGAWSRVFEYALWHGDRFGEALEALLRVAELEEQRLALAPGAVPATGVTWRDCLRTLVAQACETGHLGWLCSVPDRQLLGYARRGLSLSDAVAATLEVLATTLETSSDEVNYFECLHVYLLSRRNYHDAARIMHRFVERSSPLNPDSSSAGYASTCFYYLYHVLNCSYLFETFLTGTLRLR